MDYNDIKSRIARGEEQALQLLYYQLRAKLLRLAVQFLPSVQAAEEIVSDVFIVLWQKRHNLDHVSDLRWYLYASVKNRCLNWLRKDKAMLQLPINEKEMDYAFDITPESALISAEIIAEINQAINDLPPKCREIFVLVKEDRLKYADVANLLGISVKTVENQMAIALKKLYYLLEYIKK